MSTTPPNKEYMPIIMTPAQRSQLIISRLTGVGGEYEKLKAILELRLYFPPNSGDCHIISEFLDYSMIADRLHQLTTEFIAKNTPTK